MKPHRITKDWSPRVPSTFVGAVRELPAHAESVGRAGAQLADAWHDLTSWRSHPDPEIDAWLREFASEMDTALLIDELYPFNFSFDEIWPWELGAWYDAVLGNETE